MLVLYGTQGSGSAAAEVALDIAGLDYRKVDAASWKESPGLEELKRVNPLAQIPTLVLDDGSVLTEVAAILLHLGLDASAERPRRRRSVAARPADPRPGLHRRELLHRHRHPRLSRPLVSRPRRRRQEGDAGARPGPACTSSGRSSPTSSRPRPGSRASASARSTSSPSPSRCGAVRARRWRSRGRRSPRCSGASRPIRASPRSGRGTGRSVDARRLGGPARAHSASW